jgi:hypothetical protein
MAQIAAEAVRSFGKAAGMAAVGQGIATAGQHVGTGIANAGDSGVQHIAAGLSHPVAKATSLLTGFLCFVAGVTTAVIVAIGGDVLKAFRRRSKPGQAAPQDHPVPPNTQHRGRRRGGNGQHRASRRIGALPDSRTSSSVDNFTGDDEATPPTHVSAVDRMPPRDPVSASKEWPKAPTESKSPLSSRRRRE